MFIYVQLFVYCVIMEYHFVKLILLFLALKNVNGPDLPNLEELRDSISREEQGVYKDMCVIEYLSKGSCQSASNCFATNIFE